MFFLGRCESAIDLKNITKLRRIETDQNHHLVRRRAFLAWNLKLLGQSWSEYRVILCDGVTYCADIVASFERVWPSISTKAKSISDKSCSCLLIIWNDNSRRGCVGSRDKEDGNDTGDVMRLLGRIGKWIIRRMPSLVGEQAGVCMMLWLVLW
jgi:hypothetical protein